MSEDHLATFHAAIDAGRKFTQLHEVSGHQTVLVHPRESSVTPIPKEKLDVPRFLTGHPVFQEAAGFMAYVNAYKNSASRMWFDPKGSFCTVLDYHQPGTQGGGTSLAPLPRHGDHRTSLVLLRSPEWLVWEKANEKQMTQMEFAEFIEDNLADIVEPDAAVMVAVANGLHVTSGKTFKQALNLSTGETAFQFDEEINGTVRGMEDRKVPTKFVVGLRPFMGQPRYSVECRLRYRTNGKLTLMFKALGLDRLTEAAVTAIGQEIATATGITPAMGSSNESEHRKGV